MAVEKLPDLLNALVKKAKEVAVETGKKAAEAKQIAASKRPPHEESQRYQNAACSDWFFLGGSRRVIRLFLMTPGNSCCYAPGADVQRQAPL